MRRAAVLAALCLALAASAHRAAAHRASHKLIEELSPYNDTYITVPCDPAAVGSLPACYNPDVDAMNNVDYKWGSPSINFPTDGSPWGAHITGPYPDGKTYLISFQSGKGTVGPVASLPTDCTTKPYVKLEPSTSTGKALVYKGESITYTRRYTNAAFARYSYASPCIHHVVVDGLTPGTSYSYYLSVDGGKTYTKAERKFKTVKTGASAYPLKVGLIADLGQTNNSTETRDHLAANHPDIVLLAGDHCYADNYGAQSPDAINGIGTNQNRWDSYLYLMEKMYGAAPLLSTHGNHEVENIGIGAVINYTTTSFSYPTNYPFQSATHRFPAPGTTTGWTNITQSLYYSTVAGPVKVIVINNYIPFQPGTPQYQWASKELSSINRTATPWVIVMFHSATYHTYYAHYKEMDYFLSVYEPLFYKAGVDLVVNGHVHGYERTHPVYKYMVDDCAPMYITIGDGGNIEGPSRNFVDEVDILEHNTTYCSQLAYAGQGPNDLQAGSGFWGPIYQTQCYPPNATTLSWQPAYSVKGSPPLVPLASNTTLGFCQSSQPKWSAFRDPSFGHAILTLTSDTTAELQWYRNVAGKAVKADETKVKRKTCSWSRRRRRMSHLELRGARRTLAHS